jgi:hypothetical protein
MKNPSQPHDASKGTKTPAPRSGFSYSRPFFEELVDMALAHAKRLGATDAAAEASEGCGLSVSVRKGELENVERNRDKSLSVTVYGAASRQCQHLGFFRRRPLAQTVQAAYDIARFTAEDPMAGLPDEADIAPPADRARRSRSVLSLGHRPASRPCAAGTGVRSRGACNRASASRTAKALRCRPSSRISSARIRTAFAVAMPVRAIPCRCRPSRARATTCSATLVQLHAPSPMRWQRRMP